jgi:hypothetical protein
MLLLPLLLPAGPDPGAALVPRPIPPEIRHQLDSRGEARVLITVRRDGGEAVSAARRLQVARRLPAEIPAPDLIVERRLEAVPALVARIRARGLERLLAHPGVARVGPDGEIRGADDEALAQIGADRVQEQGYTGGGVSIAVIDSGSPFVPSPDLATSLVAEECFCSNGGACCPNGTSRQSGPGSAAGLASHGPAILGILGSAGNVSPRGIAPDASLIAVRVLDDNLIGTFGDILAALDWVAMNRPEVRLVNLSLAAGLFPANCDGMSAFNQAVAEYAELFRSRGGLLFAASGNGLRTDLMGSPACISSVVAVGAVGRGDIFANFTNANSALDLLAPGLFLDARGSFGEVFRFTGTSAATPHAVGAAALLLSAAPSLGAADLERRLVEKGIPVIDPRTGRVYPRVDVLASLVVPVGMELEPPVLTRRSRGRGFSVRVEAEPPRSALDLDPASFVLRMEGGTPVHPLEGRFEFGDADGDGTADLTLRFDRREVLDRIGAPGGLPIAVEGRFLGGPECRGAAEIRVLTAGWPVAGEPSP